MVLTVELELYFLEIENDVCDVLDHAGQRSKLVLRAGNFYRRDCRAFKGRQQHSPEGVPNGVTVAGFERLGAELCIRICGRALVFGESFRHFKTTVTDWHRL